MQPNALTTSSASLERQLCLEQDMIDRGMTRFRSSLYRAQEKGREATTSYGKLLMKQGIEPLAEAIDDFMRKAFDGSAGRRHKAAAFLEGMDSKTVAFIALRKIMDRLTRHCSYQNICVGVGREIELEKKLRCLQEDDKDRWNLTQRHIKGHKAHKYRRTVLTYAFGKSATVDFKPWAEADCLHLGQKLIDLAIQATGFFSVSTMDRGKANSTYYILTASASCREWLQKHQEASAVLNPDFLPTIIPPKPWIGASGGGYYSEQLPRLSLVKTPNTNYLRSLDEQIQAGVMPNVLKTINALQNTAWIINPKVLEVLAHLWDHTPGGVAGMPPRDGHHLPLCPVCGTDITDTATIRIRHACLDDLTPEAMLEWRRSAAVVRERNIAEFSKRMMLAKILMLARRYVAEERFYYPYQLDFRGRIYAVPAYLNPQGPDVAKGLLQFAEGKALSNMEAVKWLAIQGANTWGNDKVSLDDRYSWVLENQARILSVADDPLSNNWWHDADSPFCFLAFCLEWAGYVREGLSFVSHLPVAMDGTCNGLQIFSLILKDEVGGRAVNLLPSNKPQDIYQIVADKVIQRLEAEEDNEPVLSKKNGKFLYHPIEAAQFCLALDISRATTKRQVMVLPYGGTRESCREYTETWLKEKVYGSGQALPQNTTLFGLSVYLAGHIWDAIGDTVVAARDAMSFLQNCATVLSKAGKPIRWTSPSNFPVLQHYKPMSLHRVKTQVGDSLVYFSLREEDKNPNAVDPQRQRSALSPNFVHSLDASALMETVCLCLKHNITNFAMIHDSYGTHAADSPVLAKCLRKTFVDMFGTKHSLNHLEVFRREITAQIPMNLHKDLPITPTTGSLDVSQVENSPFFFA